ncbi:RluA family pseudouridine synthase [Buchnera aphidicola (Kurisakia onigurumii)]|uniref:RluA family pseudouridine synthase n=1 Tax=Buchnera aphidicola TaxID=9 RepID=UPI0031B685EA
MIKILNSVTFILIRQDDINQRIDNFLFKKFKHIPKSMFYKILRKGRIRVNKKRVLCKYKLQEGDRIRIPPINNVIIKNKKIIIFKKIFDFLKKSIIYEDPYFFIINKPSGIAVHGGSGLKFGIIEYFRKIYCHIPYLELVHRLDRNTSGILIISKKKSVLRELHKQLRERRIKKCYLTLTHGKWNKKNKKISLPLLKKFLHNGKKNIIVHNEGKTSITYFKIKKIYNNCTLMYAFPITGRTHQIRVHASNLGYPLLFDLNYGNSDLDKKISLNIKINKKFFLHAYKIRLFHPIKKKEIVFKAKLEDRFQNYLKTLQ